MEKLEDEKKKKKKMPKDSGSQPQTNSSMKAQSGNKALLQMAKMASTTFKDTKISNPIKSVGMKLFLIIFCSILACVMTVGLLAHSKAKSIVEKKVSEASYQTVNQVASNLDTIFKTYEDISLQLIIDKEFHEVVRDLIASGKDNMNFEANRKITEKIGTFLLSNSTIKGITLLPIEPNLNVVVAGSATKSNAEKLFDSDWFKKTMELNGKVNWIPPQPDGLATTDGSSVIGLSRVIRNGNTNIPTYLMLMEVSVDALAKRYSDVVLGEGSELFILDTEGNYISNNNPELVGEKNKIEFPLEGDKASQGSLKTKTANGDSVLAAYKKFNSMDWKLVGTIPVKELVKDAKSIQNMTWITAFIAAVLAIVIGMVVIIDISRPLVKIKNLMIEGARGNLTVRSVMNKRQDEIGELGASFNQMMKQITALAEQTTRSAADVLITATDLGDASKKTAISAKEIAVATEEIASGATSLAVEAERGTDLTGSINEQMKKVIVANQEMVRSATDVEKASEQGTTYMGVLIQKTGMTEEMTRSMVEKVDALKESTSSIVKILDVLNSITKQTNILSLNATIEAARAGAAGKGFMVVADEIRKLADQSRQSIDVVGQITAKIQFEIDETVHVLSDAYPLFQEQIESVKEANQIFLTVQGQMSQFVENLDLVTNSISQLDESQNVLAVAMTNVSAVAEESSATSEEVASLSTEQLSISDNMVQLSEKLDSVSRELKDSLSQFKIQ